MRVSILGAGAGGAAAAVELSQAGHSVSLWGRSPDTMRPFSDAGGVEYAGVLGGGLARPHLMTSDIGAAIAQTDVVLVCLPTYSHRPLARSLAQAGLRKSIPVVLNPGHTGGALEFTQTYREFADDVPPTAEFSTLTYVARKYQPHCVTVTGRAKSVGAAALPGGEAALAAAQELFAIARPVADVLATGLANINMVLHAPGAVLGAAWVEARRGDFTFYVEGMTPGVVRVMQALDQERRAVARAFGHDLPPLVAEMQAIGTVEPAITDFDNLAAAISGGTANSKIKAPDSLAHRYYREDFGYGLLPFLAFAAIAGVATPTAHSLLQLGVALTGSDFAADGRTATRMGIAGMTRDQLITYVRTH
jgi:opine dehydrogenase